MKKARYLFSDFHFEADEEEIREAKDISESLGDRGIILFWEWRTPIMALLQDWIGIEEGIYFLSDYPEEMEELMGLMHEVHKERIKLLAETDGFEFFTPMENTSTTFISPDIFRRYCKGELTEYAEIVKSQGKFYVLHMCGQLKDIMADIDAIPADAIEALTSPPVGNTTLAEAKKMCPSKAIIGGTNAALWMKSEEEIVGEIKKSVAEAGTMQGIVVSSGGQMPVACGLEKVKKVSAALKEIKWPGL